jgi:hypothetical protein
MARSEHGTNRYGTQGYSSRGQWVQSINRYLGVKFLIQGEVHYGWVRVDVAATQSGFLGAISGYAYETVPNKAILTGQKSGAPKKRDSGKGSASVEVLTPGKANLGTLALGVLGLQIWRRQDLGK